MLSFRNVVLTSVILLALASCGGGGSTTPTALSNDDMDTPATDTPSGNDDTTQNPALIASNCSAIGMDFGGDVVGSEYMESGQRNALVFGEAIGFNTWLV